MRLLLWPAVLFLCGCSASVPRPGLGGTAADLSVSLSVDAGACDDTTNPCPTGQRCAAGQCVTDNGPCTSDDDCENDTWCDCTGGGGGDAGPCTGGQCVPFGAPGGGDSNPACTGSSFQAEALVAPQVRCQWLPTKGESAGILSTPIVIDLDGDHRPEILFVTYETPAALVAIHGADCKPVFEVLGTPLSECTNLAAADLDHDGFPEIVGTSTDGRATHRVHVFDHTGKLLVSSDTDYQEMFLGDDCSAPALGDVDGDGTPEILVSGQMLRVGRKAGKMTLTEVWNHPPSVDNSNAVWGTLSLLADLDGDGTPEAVTGLKVYDGLTGKDKTPKSVGKLGTVGAYPQVADFNLDGKPDLLLVQSPRKVGGQVSIIDYAHDKLLFGPYAIPGGWGGPAVVADLDGDGVPDFGLASLSQYFAYALKCDQKKKPADCKGGSPGVLWERATQDGSSGGTASAVFDFNGDGKAEVVYRDECWLRVMSGTTGKTLFAQTVTDGTALEYPVVADIDNDGHADLVVTSSPWQNCPPEQMGGRAFAGSTEGVFVLRDPMNRWMPSRSIWNQHAYHITNVDDDGTVPRRETDNWSTYNNYRQNVQGLGAPIAAQPDFTGGQFTSADNGNADCTVSERLWANLCNRGAAPQAPGVPGAFYDSDPRQPGAKVLCTTATVGPLAPGQCEAVDCDVANPPQGARDLWFRADDDGKSASVKFECLRNNDLLYLPGYVCPSVK